MNATHASFVIAGLLLTNSGLARAQGPDVLVVHDDSLTSSVVEATGVQDVSPHRMHRGTFIDGSYWGGGLFGASLAGYPSSDMGWNRGRTMSGQIDLALGSPVVSAVDIALPSAGFRWVVGRTFSSAQDDAGYHTSDGYQGRNWHQTSQPELRFVDADANPGTEQEDDQVVIVYGADRYIEYRRVMEGGSPTDLFRGVNGSAGVVRFVEDGSGPDTYVHTDSRGSTHTFFGFDAASGVAAGSYWKKANPAGDTAYIGHATNAATAITDGFDASGRIEYAYDTNDRRYTYTYSAVDSVQRLTRVKAEIRTGGTWASPTGVSMVKQVDYSYYISTDSYGGSGDLKQATVTVPMSDAGVELEYKTYYRYWGGLFDDLTNPGYDHTIQYIVEAEGVRRLDWSDSTFDDDHFNASESVLKPYASAYFEYDANGYVDKTWSNGECGCSGATNGEYTITYGTNGSYTDTAGYDTAWSDRAVIARPDGSYVTQYFDEVGQTLQRVVSDADPAVGSPGYWVSDVVRDASGRVSTMHTPANSTGYTHSSGATTRSTTAGLVTHLTRATSGAGTGFVTDTELSDGTSGTKFPVLSVTYDLTVKDDISDGTDTFTVVRPVVDDRETYADFSGGWVAQVQEVTYSGVSGSNLQPQSMQSDPSVVSTSENGSGTAVSAKSYVRDDGTTAFTMNLDGTFDYALYADGLMNKSIRDVKTNGTFAAGDDPNTDFGITESGDGFNRVTEYTYDDQGRPDETTASYGTVSKAYRTVLADGRVVSLSIPRVKSSPTTYHGPVRYTVRNHGGQTEATGVIAIGGSGSTAALSTWIDETDSDPITAVDVGTLARLSTSLYNESGGKLTETRAYFDIPAAGAGTDGVNYDATTYAYDDMGRRIRTVDPTGTIDRQTFDSIGRGLASYVGTNDNGDPQGSPSGTNNLTKISETVYDGGSAGGNGLVTKRTVFVENSATDKRETSYLYDFRNRLIVTTPPAGPQTVVKYDNADQRIAVGLYKQTALVSAATDPTSVATDRLALTEYDYDARGRVWKTTRHEVDVSDGSLDDALESFTWYDNAGRVIKTVGTSISKTTYDRLGRATHRYAIARTDDTSYNDADDVSGDIVLEELQTVFDADDLAVMSVRIMRDPDDVGTGETEGGLDSNADTDDLLVTAANISGRVSIAAMWHDDLRRVIDTVSYGTNGGSDFDRDALSVPARSDTALRTTTVFNDDGTMLSSTDPEDIETRFEYDDLGRRTATIENYTDGTPGGGTDEDQDRVTRQAYTDGMRVTLTADLPGSSTDQVTTYTYGVTRGASAGDSRLSSNRMLAEVEYPDSASASDVVTYAYNALGQTIYTKDQAGNVLEMEYDDAGRQTARIASTVTSGFDTTVRRIETAYDDLGRADTVTQRSGVTGSDTILDQVQYSYDGWGNLITFEQDRNSAISSDAYDVQYTYVQVDHDRNTGEEVAEAVRRATMIQPDGTTVTYEYLSTYASEDRLDDDASRVTAVKSASTYVASYGYAGSAKLVETRLDEAALYSNWYDRSGGTYPGLDRFNRRVTSEWTKDVATDVNFVEIDITWDRGSNITAVEDQILGAEFDWTYTNDDLGRLIAADRGTTFEKRWTLDQVGNWDAVTLNLNADSDSDFTDTGEYDEARTHNDVNELTARDTDNDSTNDFSLTYDAVGNLTDDGEDYEYEYDVFGRMVTVKDTSTSSVVAEYTYNGLGYRLSEHVDTDADGDVDSNDPTYYFVYDERWRLAATYRGSDTDPKETFLWHAAGVFGFGDATLLDAIIHTNRDVTNGWDGAADGTLEKRFHPLQNARGDVVAVASSSGTIVERVAYDPYGLPTLFVPADQDLDGTVDGPSDYAAWQAHKASSNILGDVNGDGVVDDSDFFAWSTEFGVGDSGGRNVFTRGSTRNVIGYAGYVLCFTSSWLARHRVYNSLLGRWCHRDPLEYIDSLNLFQYVSSSPSTYYDPTGQWRSCRRLFDIDLDIDHFDLEGDSVCASELGEQTGAVVMNFLLRQTHAATPGCQRLCGYGEVCSRTGPRQWSGWTYVDNTYFPFDTIDGILDILIPLGLIDEDHPDIQKYRTFRWLCPDLDGFTITYKWRCNSGVGVCEKFSEMRPFDIRDILEFESDFSAVVR